MAGETIKQHIVKPLRSGRLMVTPEQVIAIINELANVPERFKASDLVSALPGDDYPLQQEILNRLMQRWRKLGLCVFDSGGRWRLTTNGWPTMQAAIRAYHATQEPRP